MRKRMVQYICIIWCLFILRLYFSLAAWKFISMSPPWLPSIMRLVLPTFWLFPYSDKTSSLYKLHHLQNSNPFQISVCLSLFLSISLALSLSLYLSRSPSLPLSLSSLYAHISIPITIFLSFSLSRWRSLSLSSVYMSFSLPVGSYHAISGGHIHEAFLDLTGAPSQVIDFSDPSFNSEETWLGFMWKKV